jgi:PAP2 superfamily
MSNWPNERKIAVAIWASLTVGYVLWQGIPFDRATQFLIIITAALAFSIGTTTRSVRVFADWVPFAILLYGYDYSRGAADTLGFKVRVEEIYNIELAWFGWLFEDKIPTVWLQQHLYDPNQIAWWEALVALVYVSHFVAPWAIVGILYVKNRELWAKFARRVITISFAALITYILVPAAPPWYAAREGLCEPVVRIATRGWEIIGLPIAGQIISLGQGVVNQVAAIPSLHAGMAVTITLFFWARVGLKMKAFLTFYVATMFFALVFGGEHYIFDAILGAVYALAIEYGCRAWEHRTDKRKASLGVDGSFKGL